MISIMIASRHRPVWLDETIKSCIKTADKPNEIEFIIRYDNDDDMTHEYVSNCAYNVIPMRKERVINKSVFFNEMATIASYNILGGFSDDFRFRTQGWDSYVYEIYKTKSALSIIWGKDGIQNEAIATHFFCTKKWADVLGYIWNEDFAVAYCDNIMTIQAYNSGLAIYSPELYFEHLHPAIGKAPMDNVYSESHCMTDIDTQKYTKYVQGDNPQIVKDIMKLREASNV